MENRQLAKKPGLLRLLRLVAFLTIFVMLFVQCSYLFRPRNRIYIKQLAGFYHEPPHSIDVVFVGASSTYDFWIPLLAWHKFGIVSYNFAAPSLPPAYLKYYITESLKTQHPKLFAIDLLPFIICEIARVTDAFNFTEEDLVFSRRSTDFLPYSVNRTQMINQFFKYWPFPNTFSERLEQHLDLVLFHSRWKELDESSFQFIANRYPYPDKGFMPGSEHTFFQQPPTDDFSTTDLSADIGAILVDLLDFCQQADFESYFYIPPYALLPESLPFHNAIVAIIKQRGFPVVDYNRYYEEMGLDFSTDLHNQGHVNIFGAEKYTRFLAASLLKQYALPDRRGSPEYASWNTAYTDYAQRMQKTKRVLKKKIDAYQKENPPAPAIGAEGIVAEPKTE